MEKPQALASRSIYRLFLHGECYMEAESRERLWYLVDRDIGQAGGSPKTVALLRDHGEVRKILVR